MCILHISVSNIKTILEKEYFEFDLIYSNTNKMGPYSIDHTFTVSDLLYIVTTSYCDILYIVTF